MNENLDSETSDLIPSSSQSSICSIKSNISSQSEILNQRKIKISSSSLSSDYVIEKLKSFDPNKDYYQEEIVHAKGGEVFIFYTKDENKTGKSFIYFDIK